MPLHGPSAKEGPSAGRSVLPARRLVPDARPSAARPHGLRKARPWAEWWPYGLPFTAFKGGPRIIEGRRTSCLFLIDRAGWMARTALRRLKIFEYARRLTPCGRASRTVQNEVAPFLNWGRPLNRAAHPLRRCIPARNLTRYAG